MKPIYYVCQFCNHKTSIDSFWKWFFTPHFGNKKWLKCDRCKMKHFMARKDCKWSMIDWPISK